MSRIHEALKKAEMERVASQSADGSGLSLHPPTKAANEDRHMAASVEVLTQAPATTGRSDSFSVQDMLARCPNAQWHPDPNADVFATPSKNPRGAEQFRTLRSRLYQLRGNQPLKTLLITSPAPAEGKTFVTSNLAQAIIRQADRRVLIIDGDLRRSRLHVPLGAATTPGLTDYLRGDADEATVMQHGQPGNLWFIPGGSQATNPSELLANGRIRTLLDRVASAFDWVLIDSPPCLPVADASVLADSCDGVLLVVKAGSTPAALVQKSKHELRGRTVVGVVLNAVEEDTFGYGSYYSTHYKLDLDK